MQLSGLATLALIITDVLAVVCMLFKCRSFQTKLLVGITIFCYNIASCIGVIFNSDNEKYLLSCMLYLVIMVVVMIIILDGKYRIIIRKRKEKDFQSNEIEEYINILKWLGVVYFLFIIFSTFYPTNYLSQLSASSFSVTGARFALKIARRDALEWFIGRVKLVLLPCFFIWLYTLRHDTLKFISALLIQSLCEMLQNQEITGRSGYLQIVFFILIYVAVENKIAPKKIFLFSVMLLPIIIILMVWFKNLIRGEDIALKGFGDSLSTLVQSEYNGGQGQLEYCNSVNPELDFFHYLYHCLTAPLFFLPDDGFPTLSYYFTTGVLGTTYGQVGYYVILPGAFGEGLMVLGNAFAWIYGAFMGAYTGILFRNLKRKEYFKYVYVYFMIQFAFAFRGSMQSFVLRSFNCMFYFFLLLLILRGIRHYINRKKTSGIGDSAI